MGTEINSDVVSENRELAEDLQKPIIRKLVKLKVHSSFTWGADLIGM